MVLVRRRGQSAAQVQALIDDEVGGDQMPFVMTYDNRIGATVGMITANMVYLYRTRIAKPLIVSSIRFAVGAAAGNAAVGIYTTADDVNFTRVANGAQAVVAGANTTQAIALDAPYTLLPGQDYYLAFGATDGATFTTMRVTGNIATGANTGNRSLGKAAAYSSGLPASIASPSTQQQSVWLMAA